MYIGIGGKLCAKYTKYTLMKEGLSFLKRPQRGERHGLISALIRKWPKFLTSIRLIGQGSLMQCLDGFFLGRENLWNS